jgi:hypothetical protein
MRVPRCSHEGTGFDCSTASAKRVDVRQKGGEKRRVCREGKVCWQCDMWEEWRGTRSDKSVELREHLARGVEEGHVRVLGEHEEDVGRRRGGHGIGEVRALLNNKAECLEYLAGQKAGGGGGLGELRAGGDGV